jgi:hypothetical protein
LAAVVEGDSHDDYQSQYQPRAHQLEDFTLSSQLQTYSVIEIFLHQKINGVCSAEYKAHKKQGRLLETLQDVVTCACRNIGMHVPEIERRRPRHQSVQMMMTLATKTPSKLKCGRFVGYQVASKMRQGPRHECLSLPAALLRHSFRNDRLKKRFNDLDFILPPYIMLAC